MTFSWAQDKLCVNFFWNEWRSNGHYVSPDIILTAFRVSKFEIQKFNSKDFPSIQDFLL